MPNLKDLSFELQHVSIRNPRPAEAPVQANADVNTPVNRGELAAWDLPACQLTALSLSGVAIGEQQLNYRHDTKVRHLCALSCIWQADPSVHIHCLLQYIWDCAELLGKAS